MSRPLLAGLVVRIEVLEARGLVAKDRNLMGKKTTSDPFVTVNVGNTLLGTTKVVSKTLNPVWNESFTYEMGADYAAQLMRAGNDNPNDTWKVVTLSLWDHDAFSDDDPMGGVKVPLEPLNVDDAATTKWYSVENQMEHGYCKNATGEVRIRMTYEGRQMMTLARGQTHTLLHDCVSLGLAWDVEKGQHVDLDSAIVAVDRRGRIMMQDSVYYGNLSNTNHSIQHSGDELTGESIGDDEKISLELNKIPSNVLCLYIILAVATPGKTFNDVKSAQACFISNDTSQGICRYVPHTMGQGNTALFLCRLSRDGKRWALAPIEEGCVYARDFGSLIPEIKSYTKDLLPYIVVDPHERIAVMRKGGTIRVSDYVAGDEIPSRLTLGLAWDVTNGVNIDLDASVIMLDIEYQPVEIVNYQHLNSKDGSIQHTGDEREGDEKGDDETINISLQRVNQQVKYIAFVINSYSGQELDDVAKAACHLFDPVTKKDIAMYTLSKSPDLDKHTGLIMGCLYREESSPNEWLLRIISQAAQGRTAKDLVSTLQTVLLEIPPQPPTTSFPEEEIVVSAMPDVVPIEEEIVVVAQNDFQQFAYTPVVDQEIHL